MYTCMHKTRSKENLLLVSPNHAGSVFFAIFKKNKKKSQSAWSIQDTCGAIQYFFKLK